MLAHDIFPLSSNFQDSIQKTKVKTILNDQSIINKSHHKKSDDSFLSTPKKKKNIQQLIDYYKLLNEQVTELSGRLKLEEQTKLCKICFSRAIDSVFLECFHCCSCFQCGKNLNKVSFLYKNIVSHM